MKKLSEYKDEEALDLLAEILEPVTEIIADKEVVEEFMKKSRIAGVITAIKKHKKAIIQCLAAMDGVPVEEYHCNILTLPKTLLAIINDKDFLTFFKSQSQEFMDEESSGSAMESGEDEK